MPGRTAPVLLRDSRHNPMPSRGQAKTFDAQANTKIKSYIRVKLQFSRIDGAQ